MAVKIRVRGADLAGMLKEASFGGGRVDRMRDRWLEPPDEPDDRNPACETCGDKGWIPCPKCGDIGDIECAVCQGEGKIECPECEGRSAGTMADWGYDLD